MVGVGIAFYYLRHIVICNIHAEISGRHIVYLGAPKNIFMEILATLIYLVATMGSLLVSTVKRTSVFAIVMGLSFVVSALFYRQWLTSVWCFFAAIISFIVYYIIKDASEKYNFDSQGV